LIPDFLLLWYEMGFFNSKRKIADPAAMKLSRGRKLRKLSRGRNSRPGIWDAVMGKFPILKARYDRISASKKIYVNRSLS
jgi:hypothetical protein